MKTVLVTGACINTGVDIVEKFAAEGYTVLFTGRSAEKVDAAAKAYREKFPNTQIFGYAITSLLDERTVDEGAVEAMFCDIDKKGLFVDTLVLNAADQGLNMKIFESPLTDLMKVINGATVALPAHIGDVVIANVLGLDANVVVTANAEEAE